jgi:hypothetical protein
LDAGSVDITSILLTEAGRDIHSLWDKAASGALSAEMLCFGDAISE